MGHRQQMTDKERLNWDSMQYQKRLDSKKGSNYQYWNIIHEKLLESGYELFQFVETPTSQWGKKFKKFSTSSEQHAKKSLIELRKKNNYARIVCGYEKIRQRVKMYSVIFKSKI
jgi:hypothetical protein